MRSSSKVFLAAFVWLASSTLSGGAYANCTEVALNDANCAQGVYYNDVVLSGGTRQHSVRVYIKNLCPKLDKISVRVFFQNSTTQQFETSSSTTQLRTYTGRGKGEDLRCCSNTGVCNKNEVVTNASCKSEFEKSSARSTCPEHQRERFQVYPGSNSNSDECYIGAFCRDNPRNYRSVNHSAVTVKYWEVSGLENCNGRLNHSC